MNKKILTTKEILKSMRLVSTCVLHGIFAVGGLFIIACCWLSCLGQGMTTPWLIGLIATTVLFGAIFVWYMGLYRIFRKLRQTRGIRKGRFLICEDVVIGKQELQEGNRTTYTLIFEKHTKPPKKGVAVTHREYRRADIGEHYYIVDCTKTDDSYAFSADKYILVEDEKTQKKRDDAK